MYSNRVYNGGSYNYNGLERPAYYKSSSYPNRSASNVGTRTIMYIK